VLDELSFSAKRGEKIALVGASGAGKTTLVDIILGLLEPQEGSIFVDGSDIHGNIRGWQKNIGYIPQSIYLLDDTIRRNIAFGIPDEEINEEKLYDSIQAAQLEELISKLSQKDQTIVGEQGIRLSGGQRQRIGIARALYNNPQVLIMDEATSSLDNVTEKIVIKAIEKLRGDRTIIMIAHRLTTVKNCDMLYFMKRGRIMDFGSYGELISANENFREMALS
jgi:ATP-binding cassette subfamily C protein